MHYLALISFLAVSENCNDTVHYFSLEPLEILCVYMYAVESESLYWVLVCFG
jgi:hypothetical protein